MQSLNLIYPWHFLERVNLQVPFRSKAFLKEKLLYVLAQVSLKLDYLAELFVVNHCAVTPPALLKFAIDSTEIQLWIKALDGCDGFPPISLLNANVNTSVVETILFLFHGNLHFYSETLATKIHKKKRKIMKKNTTKAKLSSKTVRGTIPDDVID